MPISMDLPEGPEKPYAVGRLLEELLVTDLTVDGKAVARNKNHVVFLDAGLPGEILSARVVKITQKVIYARVERSLCSSPYAVAAWCPHSTPCGACLWQHFSLESARDWKQKHIREILSRIGKVPAPEVFALVPAPDAREYRNKMTFAFMPNPDADTTKKTLLGLRKFKEQALVEVTHCGLQPQIVMRLLRHVRQAINILGLEAWQQNRGGYLRFFIVHTPSYAPQGKKQMVVECITGSYQENSGKSDGSERHRKISDADKVRHLGLELMKKFELTGFIHSERTLSSDVAQGERIIFTAGSCEYQERFGHLLLTVPHNVFLQTNSAVAGLLYAGVKEEAALTGQEIVWDLYSGMGGIALYLADQAQEVHGVETHADAVAAAQQNSIAYGYLHCRFHLGSLSPSLLSSLPRPDVIIADPPRSGLNENISRFLLTVPAQRLIYVSCDPGTQARDIARLSSSWKVRYSRPYDMFPYTPHVENIAVLEGQTR